LKVGKCLGNGFWEAERRYSNEKMIKEKKGGGKKARDP